MCRCLGVCPFVGVQSAILVAFGVYLADETDSVATSKRAMRV